MKEVTVIFGREKQFAITVAFGEAPKREKAAEVKGASLLDILNGLSLSEKKAALQYLLKNTAEVEND